MKDSKDLDETITPKFLSSCFSQIVALTQLSNSFPEKDELGFYRRIPSCNQNIKSINTIIGETIKLISDFGLESNKVDPQKTIKYNNVIDTLDGYLENVDLTLDKIKEHTTAERPLIVKEQGNQGQYIERNIEEKPQYKFDDRVDNSEEYPFVPKITQKFNSEVPLNEKILLAQHNKIDFFHNIQNPPDYEFVHPYETEINNLEYQDFQFELEIQSQKPVALIKDTFLYVDDEVTLQNLLNDLRKDGIKEIAIDLEHHSYRSFQGFTCLMQLSTREKDYIVDTLSLRSHLQQLNEIFTNPKIVKVLHGADMDIEWLQKDFGIYVVNMFDTGQASRFLKLPSSGLAYLMKEICNVTANKEYQTADWRKRPLPREMVKYAREDTHYLLYIYDEMRKKVIQTAGETNLGPIESLKSVLNKSKLVCLKTYKKSKLKSDQYYNIMHRNKPILSYKKYKILKAIYKWRDSVARLEDENTGFILPMNLAFEIVELNPKSTDELYSRVRKINYVAKRHIMKLIEDIKKVNETLSREKVKEDKNLLDAVSVKPLHTAHIHTNILRHNIVDTDLPQSERFSLADDNNHIDFQRLQIRDREEHTHNYHKIFATQKEAASEKKTFNKVKGSFNYGSFYDFTMSLQPNFQNDVVTMQREYDRAAREKFVQQLELNKQSLNQANLGTNNEGYIEFVEEKGPASKKEAPSLSLGLTNDENNSLPHLPPSLREQHQVQMTKKNKKKNNKRNNPNDKSAEVFNERVKKLKTNLEEAKTAEKKNNKFDALMNSSNDEEEMPQNLSKTNKKAFQKFWEKNSKLETDDPLHTFLKKDANPNYSKSKGKRVNFQKNKYSRKGVQK